MMLIVNRKKWDQKSVRHESLKFDIGTGMGMERSCAFEDYHKDSNSSGAKWPSSLTFEPTANFDMSISVSSGSGELGAPFSLSVTKLSPHSVCLTSTQQKNV